MTCDTRARMLPANDKREVSTFWSWLPAGDLDAGEIRSADARPHPGGYVRHPGRTSGRGKRLELYENRASCRPQLAVAGANREDASSDLFVLVGT